MKKWKIAAAAACVCFLLTVGYAANAGTAGSSSDPLVTLSYLNNTFAKQVQTMVNDAVTAWKAELEQALNAAAAGNGTASANPGVSAPGGSGAVFSVVTLSRGQALVGEVGCEVMLRVGSAVCSSPDTVGLIDTTSGENLTNGGSLATNHLYMVTIDGRSVTAASDTVRVLVRGPYTIR